MARKTRPFFHHSDRINLNNIAGRLWSTSTFLRSAASFRIITSITPSSGVAWFCCFVFLSASNEVNIGSAMLMLPLQLKSFIAHDLSTISLPVSLQLPFTSIHLLYYSNLVSLVAKTLTMTVLEMLSVLVVLQVTRCFWQLHNHSHEI